MPAILSIQKYAKMLAWADIATQASQVKTQGTDLKAQSNGLTQLQSALSTFQTAVDGLNSSTDGPVANMVSSSSDDVSASADSTALPGSYTFYVNSLAQSQQTAIAMDSAGVPASGTFSLTMNGNTMDIDLSSADTDGDGNVSPTELATAINNSDSNTGITATVVNTDGKQTLMLTGPTGAENAFTVSATNNSSLSNELTSSQDLTTAQNFTATLGSSSGPEITSDSNSLDDLIPGVSIDFSEAPTDGTPITITVSQDAGTSQQRVQAFVDAYNTLVDTLDSLTDLGTNGSAGGVFAGDSGINSLTNQLQTITHQSYNGSTLVDYGITLDTNGHLQIDATQFAAGMEENPEGLTDIFVGPDSMTAQIDSLLSSWLDPTTGIIASREQSVDRQEDKLRDTAENLKDTYTNNYNRYVQEFSATMTEISNMQTSMMMFM